MPPSPLYREAMTDGMPLSVCCSVFAVRCSALQCIAVRCSALQCVAVRCSALQCVAMRCSALQCVAVRCIGEGAWDVLTRRKYSSN